MGEKKIDFISLFLPLLFPTDMAFNYTDRSRDFACLVPGNEPYTLRVAGQPDVLLPSVLTQPMSYKEELPAGGTVQQGDLLAVWPIAASRQPPLGSKLIDSAGVVWTILTVVRKDQVATWECTARNLAVAYNLNNSATILKAQYTKSPAGAAVAAWAPIGPAVPARFQPESQDAQIFEDAEWTKTVFTVILSARRRRLDRLSDRIGRLELPPDGQPGAALPRHQVSAGPADRCPADGHRAPGARRCGRIADAACVVERMKMPTATALLEAIQAAWSADAVLSALVPDSRAYFGKVPPLGSEEGQPDVTPEMPYVRIEKPKGRGVGTRSNAALYKDVAVVFHIWTDNPEDGETIADEVERVFSQDLAWTDGAVIDSRSRRTGRPRSIGLRSTNGRPFARSPCGRGSRGPIFRPRADNDQ